MHGSEPEQVPAITLSLPFRHDGIISLPKGAANWTGRKEIQTHNQLHTAPHSCMGQRGRAVHSPVPAEPSCPHRASPGTEQKRVSPPMYPLCSEDRGGPHAPNAIAWNTGNPLQRTRVSKFIKHWTNPLRLPVPFPTHVIQRWKYQGFLTQRIL